MLNLQMQEKLASRESLDVRSLGREIEPGLFNSIITSKKLSYCDGEKGEWIWSIGNSRDGEIYAATDNRFYLNPNLRVPMAKIITQRLSTARATILTDVTSLNSLSESNLETYKSLQVWIRVLELKIEESGAIKLVTDEDSLEKFKQRVEKEFRADPYIAGCEIF